MHADIRMHARPITLPELLQSAQGYRYAVDSVLLIQMVPPGQVEHLMDLGTGNGILIIGLAMNGVTFQHATGIEIQASLVRLARRNIRRAGLADRVEILHADIRRRFELNQRGRSDLLVCNPPYRSPVRGRIPPDTERAVARHEIAGRLRDFLRVAHRWAKPEARFYLIYPWRRSQYLFKTLEKTHWYPFHVDLCYQKHPGRIDFVRLGLRPRPPEGPVIRTITRFTHRKGAVETAVLENDEFWRSFKMGSPDAQS